MVYNTSFCYNTGDINLECSFINNVRTGGIAGLASKEIQNCYNTGNVEPIVYNEGMSISGGIVGYVGGNSSLLSCYNIGYVNGDSSSGLIGQIENEDGFVADNCFMAEHNESIGYGELLSTDFMKSDEFVTMLNKYNDYYKKDVEPFVNDGYPIIDTEKIPAFDIDGTFGVKETNTDNNISVYPNPAKDFVKVSTDNGQQTTVKIYNTVGMLVGTRLATSATNEIEINVSEYNPGIYFINISNEESNVTKKIVVE